MAVQQNKKTRSKRDMRRAHDQVEVATLSVDSTTGVKHRRHHISSEGFYRGKEIIPEKVVEEKESEEPT